MHISAMVPPCGPAGTSCAFPNESNEPLWARNMRPLRLPDPYPLAQTRMATVLEPTVHGVLRCGSEVENSAASAVSNGTNHVHCTRDPHSFGVSLCWRPRCSATHCSRRAMLALGLRYTSCHARQNHVTSSHLVSFQLMPSHRTMHALSRQVTSCWKMQHATCTARRNAK